MRGLQATVVTFLILLGFGPTRFLWALSRDQAQRPLATGSWCRLVHIRDGRPFPVLLSWMCRLLPAAPGRWASAGRTHWTLARRN